MVALRILEQCSITPPPATGPRPALPLTFFDIPWLYLNPVDRLFFYNFPHSTADFLESHLPNLKSSLSHTLNNFYPLAGAIRRSSANDDRFEIRYSDGDYVPLTVCEFKNMDFGDISGYHRRPFDKLLLLVPSMPKSDDAIPLLAIQITLFPNQGLCISLKIHHAACDGFSSIHFLKSWSSTHNSSPSPPPPSLNRSSISDPNSLYSKLSQKILLQKPLLPHTTTPSPSQQLFSSTFTLPSLQIQTIKHQLQSKRAPKHQPHISTFVISTSCAWICLLNTKRKHGGEGPLGRTAHLFFSVDWRNRLRPPPPANYFGNCLGCPCFVEAAVGDIVEEKDGFFVACEGVGGAIDGIGVGDDVYEGMEGVLEKVKSVLMNKPLSIAGSHKLRVYDVDFGWGKPLKVEVTSIGNSGAFSMAESRDDEGGVEIGVVLPEDEMVEFKKEFDKFVSKYD